MNTSTSIFGHGSKVDVHVADLAEEVVLVGPPVATGRVVRVGVQDSHASELSGSCDDRAVGCVADQLGVVIHLNWLRNLVGAAGEVDNSRGDGGRVAPRVVAAASDSGAVRVTDGLVDGFGVISVTVTDGSVIFDVAENLVFGIISPDGSLALDGLHPVARRRLARCQRCGSGRNK